MIDLYNPTLDAHMSCTPSAVKVWRKYGWLPYSEWLAAQTPAADPTPVPAPATSPETTTADTTDSSVTLV